MLLLAAAGFSLYLILASGCGGNNQSPNELTSFALLGDVPRIGDDIEPDLLPFIRVRDEINASDLDFVIHVGDFKSGSSPCDDASFERWYDLVQSFQPPFFFVPGDNEWTDCHRPQAGGFDPLERLDKLREMFFSSPKSLGQHTLDVIRQSETASDPRFAIFSEHYRWTYDNVMFVALNVQGSNNNLGRTEEMDAEYRLRNEAGIAFLSDSFTQARENGIAGIVISIQANPRFDRRPDEVGPDGYRDFREALERETLSFDQRPVYLLHGDSHYFRIDKPLYSSVSGRRIENFTRIESFGSPDNHWVYITIVHDDPNLLRVEQRIVKGNLLNHTIK